MIVNPSSLNPNSPQHLPPPSGSCVLQPSGSPNDAGRLTCHSGLDWPVEILQSHLYLEYRKFCRTRSPKASALGPNLAQSQFPSFYFLCRRQMGPCLIEPIKRREKIKRRHFPSLQNHGLRPPGGVCHFTPPAQSLISDDLECKRGKFFCSLVGFPFFSLSVFLWCLQCCPCSNQDPSLL